MMPHGGRSIQEEMARFEAEVNAARAQQFIMGAAGAPMAAAVVTSQAVLSAPPTGAVISAPPSRPVVKDDDDILATLEKYEKEVKEAPKKQNYTGKLCLRTVNLASNFFNTTFFQLLPKTLPRKKLK